MIRFRCLICRISLLLPTPIASPPRCIGETCGHAYLVADGEAS